MHAQFRIKVCRAHTARVKEQDETDQAACTAGNPPVCDPFPRDPTARHDVVQGELQRGGSCQLPYQLLNKSSRSHGI